MDIDVAIRANAVCGESPTWIAAEQCLYWIDVKAPALHRSDLATGRTRTWRMPTDIGAFAFAPARSGAIVALRNGIYLLEFSSGCLRRIAKAPFDSSRFRFNEGICDSLGRLWLGVMFEPVAGNIDSEPAQIYNFTLDGGLVPLAPQYQVPNGMAFSADEQFYYASDSSSGEIHRYLFDTTSGLIGEPAHFATVPSDMGVPDGAAVDIDGGYWVALHGAGRLRRFASDGRVDFDVPLPVTKPTMCVFGGPDMGTLYVTTATQRMSPGQLSAEPLAGSVLRCRPGTRGILRNHIVR